MPAFVWSCMLNAFLCEWSWILNACLYVVLDVECRLVCVVLNVEGMLVRRFGWFMPACVWFWMLNACLCVWSWMLNAGLCIVLDVECLVVCGLEC
jgi:hypothetical protein